jgi:hypothetical protein
MPWKAVMMPTTVPSRPTNGATDPTDARTPIPRRSSSPTASFWRSASRRASSTRVRFFSSVDVSLRRIGAMRRANGEALWSSASAAASGYCSAPSSLTTAPRNLRVSPFARVSATQRSTTTARLIVAMTSKSEAMILLINPMLAQMWIGLNDMTCSFAGGFRNA